MKDRINDIKYMLHCSTFLFVKPSALKAIEFLKNNENAK